MTLYFIITYHYNLKKERPYSIRLSLSFVFTIFADHYQPQRWHNMFKIGKAITAYVNYVVFPISGFLKYLKVTLGINVTAITYFMFTTWWTSWKIWKVTLGEFKHDCVILPLIKTKLVAIHCTFADVKISTNFRAL